MKDVTPFWHQVSRSLLDDDRQIEEILREARDSVAREVPEKLRETFSNRAFITKLAHHLLSELERSQEAIGSDREESIAEDLERATTPRENDRKILGSWFDPKKWPMIRSKSINRDERIFALSLAAYFINSQEDGLRRALGDDWPARIGQASLKST